jgi:hypothetical protein
MFWDSHGVGGDGEVLGGVPSRSPRLPVQILSAGGRVCRSGFHRRRITAAVASAFGSASAVRRARIDGSIRWTTVPEDTRSRWSDPARGPASRLARTVGVHEAHFGLRGQARARGAHDARRAELIRARLRAAADRASRATGRSARDDAYVRTSHARGWVHAGSRCALPLAIGRRGGRRASRGAAHLSAHAGWASAR